MKMFYLYASKGFTFIETIISLAIILLLSGSVGFSAFRYLERAKVAAVSVQIETYSAALQSYYLDNGQFPSSAQGLDALWEKPYLDPIPVRWFGPYIDRPIRPDPWGHNYTYLSPGDNGEEFVVKSPGAQI